MTTETTIFAIVSQPQAGKDGVTRAVIEQVLELPDEPQDELAREYGVRFVHLPMGGEVGQPVTISEDGVADVVEEAV